LLETYNPLDNRRKGREIGRNAKWGGNLKKKGANATGSLY